MPQLNTVPLRVPMLSGGISQQPSHIRYNNQVADAINAQFSVVNGCSKRPGSVYVGGGGSAGDEKIGRLTADQNYRLHKIQRDNSEQYLVVYGPTVFRIFDINGSEATVTKTAAASAYLDSGSPTADDLRMTTVGDNTIILNTKVTTGTERVLEVYTITETYDTWTKMASQLATPNAYYRTTAADGIHQAGYYQYRPIEPVSGGGGGEPPDPGHNGYPYWGLTSSVSGDWRTVGGDWDASSRNPWGVRMRFRRQLLAKQGLDYDHTGHAEGEKRLYKVGAFADYTFIAGDEIYINDSGGNSLPKGWYPIASRVDDDAILLSGTYRTLTLSPGGNPIDASASIPASDEDDSDCEYISVSGLASSNFYTTAATDMDDVAQRLQASIQALDGLANTLISWQPIGNGGYMQVVAPYSGTDSTIINFYTPDSGGDLTTWDDSPEPFDFSDGVLTAGASVTGTTADSNYGSVDISDRWMQVPSPGDSGNQIDPDTMPIKMTRTSLGPPVVFELDVIDWRYRFSGNHETNPAPSFIANKDGSAADAAIRDIGFHRNRFAMVGNENIVFSQAGDYFNLFATDAANLVDSDPIDVALASDAVTVLDFIVPFRKSLLLFTQSSRQFDMNSPETLTPSTVSITPSTSYATISTRPKQLGEFIYFATELGDYAIIYEYFYDDLRVNNVATDITAHSQQMIPKDIKTIETDTTTSQVFVLTDTSSDIFVYRSHWSGRQKSQSAWTKWSFGNNRIVDVATMDDGKLWILMEDNATDNYFFETVDISQP